MHIQTQTSASISEKGKHHLEVLQVNRCDQLPRGAETLHAACNLGMLPKLLVSQMDMLSVTDFRPTSVNLFPGSRVQAYAFYYNGEKLLCTAMTLSKHGR